MKLVYKTTQQLVKVGDTVKLNGEHFSVLDFLPPHKPDSEGKVTVRHISSDSATGTSLYVSIIGAEWIEREDRPDTAPTKD